MIASSTKDYLFPQSRYIVDIFKYVLLTNNMTIDTLVDLNDQCSLSDGSPLLNLNLYHIVVGNLVISPSIHPHISRAI